MSDSTAPHVMRRLLIAPIASRVGRLTDQWRYPTIHAKDPCGGRSGDEILLSLGTGRRWRYGLDVRLTVEDAEHLAEQLAEDAAEGRAWRVAAGRVPAPEHVGGNAEDCPACALIPSDQIPYPWHCPGPDLKEAR